MPDDTTAGGQQAAAGLTIPADVQAKFGPLIELIQGSESMNTEERRYWINILPIMTPEQLKNLEEILMNEKKQLAAIDDKYTKESATIGDEKVVAELEKEIVDKRKRREAMEHQLAAEEGKAEENILKQIQNI